MHLSVTQQKTLLDQVRPGLAAVALVAAGYFFIPIHYPVVVTNGSITPNVVRPADKAEVHWMQDWRDLCPLTITREFVGADGFKKTAASYEFSAPKEKGLVPYSGTMIVPDLPVGDAYYHSVIQPHCWIDKVWQRTYRTPEIRLTMIPALPTGPR